MASIIGSGGSDTQVGTDTADFINLRQGDDTGSGLGGADQLRGGADGDRLFGGTGRDTILGDNGADRLEGERGDDRLFGGAGHDRLRGELGDDRLFGGDGRDQLEGGEGGNVLTGGDGLDRFVMTAVDEAPFGMTVRQFDRALDDPFKSEELLVAAVAAGPTDVITDAEDNEHAIVSAGFRVQDIFFTVIGGIDVDGDGDGSGGDTVGVIGFYGPNNAASMKLFALPDQFREVEIFDIAQTTTGVDMDFLEF